MFFKKHRKKSLGPFPNGCYFTHLMIDNLERDTKRYLLKTIQSLFFFYKLADFFKIIRIAMKWVIDPKIRVLINLELTFKSPV